VILSKLCRITPDHHMHIDHSVSKPCWSNDSNYERLTAVLCWSSLHAALLPLLTPWLSTHLLFLPTELLTIPHPILFLIVCILQASMSDPIPSSSLLLPSIGSSLSSSPSSLLETCESLSSSSPSPSFASSPCQDTLTYSAFSSRSV